MVGIVTVVGFVISILIVIEIFVIGHATSESRKELQQLRQFCLIALSLQHHDFSIIGRGVRLNSSPSDGSEFPTYIDGYEWTSIAQGDVDKSKPAKVVGFRGDKLLVSNYEAEA